MPSQPLLLHIEAADAADGSHTRRLAPCAPASSDGSWSRPRQAHGSTLPKGAAVKPRP